MAMNYRKPLPLILSLALAAGMLFQAGTPAGAQAIDQAALAQALAAQTGQSSGGTAPTVAPAQPSINNLTAPGTAAATTPTAAAAATGTAATAGAVGTAGAAGTVGADGTSSPIETMFAGQAAALGGKTQVLRQFGYSLFDKPATPSLASIGDDYVLGPGDGLVLYLWGDPVDIKEISASYSLSVDRNGFVFLPPAG
ncbi:MAG: hypothetical protein WAX33_10260, partial [Rectinemataceae bacterium]